MTDSKRVPNPGWIGGAAFTPEDVMAAFKKVREEQTAELRASESPEAFIRQKAPRVLSLYPGPWTEELAFAETTAGWQMADARMAQCAVCPAHGGACLDSRDEGKLVVVTQNLQEPVRYEACGKWRIFRERRRVRRAGVPDSHLEWTLRNLFGEEPNEQVTRLRSWIVAAGTGDPMPSFLLTGGEHSDRRKLATAIAHEAVMRTKKRVHYTFAPKLFMDMRDYLKNEEGGENPFETCTEADIFVMDFVDPKPVSREPWSEWFTARVDTMLWTRLSGCKPTVLSSRASRAELWGNFDYCSGIEIGELDISTLPFI
jgi:hypothetical protein